MGDFCLLNPIQILQVFFKIVFNENQIQILTGTIFLYFDNLIIFIMECSLFFICSFMINHESFLEDTKSTSAISDQLKSQTENLKIGHYIIHKCIGNGAYGKVHKGIHSLTGQKVAIKILEKSKITHKDIPRVKRQIQILSKLHHPCIVQLYEVMENSKHIFMIMQYIPNGELFKYIVNHKKLGQEQACRIFQQIINAIQYFHICGVAHRDLKPQNILIDQDQRIKIIDFGLSNNYQSGTKLQTFCGSPCYIPPEMLDGKISYDPLKVDIWSSGIILYTMLCGCLPFCDNSPKKVYEKIKLGHFKVPKTLTVEAKNLISKLLTTNPSKRLTIQQIKVHKWWENSAEYKVYGIVPQKHCIPVQTFIIDKMKQKGFDQQKLRLSIKKNIHHSDTSCYYILLKKFAREGGNSQCYLSSKSFNPLLLQETQFYMDEADSNDLSDNLGMIPRPSDPPLPEEDNCQDQDLLNEFLQRQTLELTKQFLSMFKINDNTVQRSFRTSKTVGKKTQEASVSKIKHQKFPSISVAKRNIELTIKVNDKPYRYSKTLQKTPRYFETKKSQIIQEKQETKKSQIIHQKQKINKITKINEDKSTIIVINKGIINLGIPKICQRSTKIKKQSLNKDSQ